MTESGGAATQAGIFYQNSVAALALADLLDLSQLSAHERVLDVRVEAPEHVDDIVLRFADGHQDFQSAKLSLRVGTAAWAALWKRLDAQMRSQEFGPVDQLTIVVAERNTACDAVAELCQRAAYSVDRNEFEQRLGESQKNALASIATLLGGQTSAFELLRRTRLLHYSQDSIERELGRRRLAGGSHALISLLPILRDILGGASRRRGLFRPASLRSRLKSEHRLLLEDPPEWGLAAFRTASQQMARLTIPGTMISGPAERMFVWPRARAFDVSKTTDFEDENLEFLRTDEETNIDLRNFPEGQFNRVVVVAGPGHGKSALLTAITSRIIEGPFVPVAVPLASLAAADAGIIQFLRTTMEKELEISADWERLAEQGLLVLLLDGLDEVPATSRPNLLRRITNFSARYPHAPWMLTVRDAAVLGALPRATIVELLQLNDDDIERFASTMSDRIGDLEPWEIARRLKLYPDLDRLARIPLFLMMLLATTDLSNPKPLTRSDLIEGYLSTLFSPERLKATASSNDRGATLRVIAETLAYERLERQEIGATEREVRELVNRLIPDAGEAEMLVERLRTNGILRPQSAIRLQFPYPIVQEYLAARHLIEKYPESLGDRIEDAVQRPWAQVIQFALEIAPAPEPIVKAMLEREDDAFATGLRLVGRCVANGAHISESLRLSVGERLVAFWEHAPSEARERVGRVLADGFWDLVSPRFDAALHLRWLLQDGAGEILSKRKDTKITLSVLKKLIDDDRDSSGIHHSFKFALRAAGDEALRLIYEAMDPEIEDAETITRISGLLWNFDPPSVSTELALAIARDERLPRQARLRAYKLVGQPLEDAGITLAISAFEDVEWNRNYAACELIATHSNPPVFMDRLLRMSSISIERRVELASSMSQYITDADCRTLLALSLIVDESVHKDIRIALRLMEARFGNVEQFRSLVAEIPTLPMQSAATTIALFGHHPDRALAEQAAILARARAQKGSDIAQIATSAPTGLRNVFEMNWSFGGAVRPAPPHAGIEAWIELLEYWSEQPHLGAQDRMKVRTAAADLGSELMMAVLEQDIISIIDFDDQIWTIDDEGGHTLSHALHQLQRRLPTFPSETIERLLRSRRYNISSAAIRALSDRGDYDSLRQLANLHRSRRDWMLRDLIANTIELLAARLGVIVRKDGSSYQLS